MKYIYAADDYNFYKPNDDSSLSTKINNKAEVIIGNIRAIGTLVSVGALIVIGIKYMLGSVEEKAEYKKTMIPYLIGAFLVFGITVVPTIIYNFVSKW